MLPLDRVLEPRDGYLVGRSPRHPGHYWGNLLLFDRSPAAGDCRRWEESFDAEFAARGYDLEETVGLIATADGLRPHPRENRDVVVRALDPGAVVRRARRLVRGPLPRR